MTVPHPDPKPLEPWAVELLRQEHAGDDPFTQQELARLVALLRALPDPTPSPDLAIRILAHVAARGSRPRVVHALFGAGRSLARPGAAAMLAAGIAALFAVTLSPESIPSVFRTGTGSAVDTTGATQVTAAAARSGTLRRRPPVVRPHFVSAAFAQTPALGLRIRPERAPMDEAFDARLDRQLNQLMIDPTAFAQRLELVAQRDQFIARLAERASERGDAPEIALRVRESQHPLAGQIVERMLRATLVAAVSPR